MLITPLLRFFGTLAIVHTRSARSEIAERSTTMDVRSSFNPLFVDNSSTICNRHDHPMPFHACSSVSVVSSIFSSLSALWRGWRNVRLFGLCNRFSTQFSMLKGTGLRSRHFQAPASPARPMGNVLLHFCLVG